MRRLQPRPPSGPVPLQQITREQWVRWVWVDVSGLKDPHRMMVPAHERLPYAIEAAGREWDAFDAAWGGGIESSGQTG